MEHSLTIDSTMTRNILTLLLCLCKVFAYEFPPDFKFGVATSSYQVEGAWNISGKGENIWDYICHNNPDFINNRDNGDISADAYHHVTEDVQLLKELGVDFYRFSLSWSRILPSGFTNVINPDGIRYYNELINSLLANGIEPFVTLYHWDLPQPLQEIGGWPNPLLADHFVEYARVAFEHFGDRVKYWLTFNEPHQTCQLGYSNGVLAPGYKSEGIACYLCSRTLLLAHAKTYRLYDTTFKSTQNGKVSITIDGQWWEPATASPEDIAAAERARIMGSFSWFAHPILNGDYPPVMKERIAQFSAEEGFSESRLVPFSDEEIQLIYGTFDDFIGFNHYTTRYISDGDPGYSRPSYYADIGVTYTADSEWETAQSTWLKVVPWGFRNHLKWIKDTFNNPEIIVTENGFADSDGINDCRRINFYNSYLEELLKAKYDDDVNVTGYFAWSFIDNFEWTSGYSSRFGLVHIDFTSDERTRTKKQSYEIFRNIIQTKNIDWNFTPENFQKCTWV